LAGKNELKAPTSPRLSRLRGTSKKQDDVVGTIATLHKGEETPFVVKISDDGVKFRSVFDGTLIEFTPETSMEYQRIIGADMNMAFDECTYYPSTHEYAEKAMRRTHEWLKRCISFRAIDSAPALLPASAHKLRAIGDPSARATYRANNSTFLPSLKQQYLYGIIQGGTFEDLRKQSAEFVVSQDVDGIGETKKEMRDQVKWVAPFLPPDKPVHLLGVGQIDDIVDLVKHGIDTFDCVEPTRLARMGTILKIKNLEFRIQNKRQKDDFSYEIDRGIYKDDLSPLDEECECNVCRQFTKAYLHHLFKQRELLGYSLATYHNLWVMEKLMEIIRKRIEENNL